MMNKDRLTLDSTVCHFSSILSASNRHICSRTSLYAFARSSNLAPSQLSALLRFSMRRFMPFAAGIGGLVWKVVVGDRLPIESLLTNSHEKLVFVLGPRARGVAISARLWRADSLLWCG